MQIIDLLGHESIIADLKVSSKKQVLHDLSSRAAGVSHLQERIIFDVLLERERLGTTGVGSGVAIPHGRFPELKQLYGLFAKLEKPVNFESVDEQPVDLIFLLLAPESAGADHLKALARVSCMLRDKDFCEKLRGISDPEAMYALFAENDSTYSE